MRSFMGKIKPFSVELLRGRVIFCLKTTRASNCQIETGPIWAAFRIIPAPQTLLFCHFAMNSFNQAVLQAERQLIAANLFYGHGMLNAYDEAVYAALFCNQGDYAAIDWDAQYPAAAQQTLDAMIAQRCDTRKPMAYLTHEAFLHGFKFYVDERVIVPRSFIAELILDEFSPWVNAEQVHDVLELCTGSGCLAMMAAHVFEHAAVDAIDIDADALDVARHNDALYGQAYGTAGRINWIESDLYTHVPPKQYDVIFSNPPYVNSASMDKLGFWWLRLAMSTNLPVQRLSSIHWCGWTRAAQKMRCFYSLPKICKRWHKCPHKAITCRIELLPIHKRTQT
jgi:ribosomal protein L3 glutamine methyltransferase